MSGIIGRKGKEWRLLRAQVLRGATQCQMPWCRYPGVPLDDKDLVRGRPGPLYPTVDHLIPKSWTEGWSRSDQLAALHNPRYLRPAHNGCNASRGNRRDVKRPPIEHTRDWGV